MSRANPALLVRYLIFSFFIKSLINQCDKLWSIAVGVTPSATTEVPYSYEQWGKQTWQVKKKRCDSPSLSSLPSCRRTGAKSTGSKPLRRRRPWWRRRSQGPFPTRLQAGSCPGWRARLHCTMRRSTKNILPINQSVSQRKKTVSQQTNQSVSGPNNKSINQSVDPWVVGEATKPEARK